MDRADLPLRLVLMSDIGAQIREAREALGMSQAELGRIAGVDPRTVRRIESGESRYPAKAGLLQKVLHIGPYAPPASRAGAETDEDVLLREATFPELVQQMLTRYGQDIRATERRAAGDAPSTERVQIDTLPPEILALGPDGVVGDWTSPKEGRSSG